MQLPARGKRALALFLQSREEKDVFMFMFREGCNASMHYLVGKLKEGSIHEGMPMDMQIKTTEAK